MFPSCFTHHLQGKKGTIKIRRAGTFRVWTAWLDVRKKSDGGLVYDINGKDGWTAFWKENFINNGDIMLFQYPGNGVFIFRLYDSFGMVKKISPGPNPYLVGGRVKLTDYAFWKTEAATGADTYIRYSPYPCFKLLMSKQYVTAGYVVK